tara:strand:- start:774 stop:1184 length:411 start_codon:yes stop_codon:yes gene_type:complete
MPKVKKLNMLQLDDLFKEAAETERKLPAAIRKQKLATWPDYVKEWAAYGYTKFNPGMLKASPGEISRLDYAIDLGLKFLNNEDRKLVWAVAISAAFRDRGAQWSKIGKILGIKDPRIVKRRYMNALSRLFYQQCKS